MKEERSKTGYDDKDVYDRGYGGESTDGKKGEGMRRIMEACEEETGLPAPRPQWEKKAYGPHVALPYVKGWYERMGREGYGGWEF